MAQLWVSCAHSLHLLIQTNCCTLQLWVLAANLEVRAKRVDAARRIMGMAIGMAPKDKTFKSYIEMELALGHVDR